VPFSSGVDIEINSPWEVRHGTVYAVENPNVFYTLLLPIRRAVAVENRPTLVCLHGSFSHACESLLEVLLARAVLKFSTDDDTGGSTIRSRVLANWPTSRQLSAETFGKYEEQNQAEILRIIVEDLQRARVPRGECAALSEEADLIELSRGI
jgi:hypothetical protein